jgi:hypothetical protein
MARYIQVRNLTGFDEEAGMIADGVEACQKIASELAALYEQPVAVDFEVTADFYTFWDYYLTTQIVYRFFSSPHNGDTICSFTTADFYTFVDFISWLLKGGPNAT